MPTCRYVNQNGQRCRQPEGHTNNHGNGTLTQGRQTWSLPEPRLEDIPPNFCLKPSDPITPSLIKLWILSAQRLKINPEKILDAAFRLEAINHYQATFGTKKPD